MRSESIVNAVIKSKKFWGYALLISVLLILVLLLRGEVLSQNWEQQLVQSLIGGTVAAIFLSVLIHLGLVLDTKEIHERTRKTIKDRLDHQRNEIISKVEDKSHDIVNRVGEKFEARYKWGLHSVIETITEGNELDDVENSEVMWLNTKFEDAELQAKVIRSAVERQSITKMSKRLKTKPGSTKSAHKNPQLRWFVYTTTWRKSILSNNARAQPKLIKKSNASNRDLISDFTKTPLRSQCFSGKASTSNAASQVFI